MGIISVSSEEIGNDERGRMLEHARQVRTGEGEYVDFFVTGMPAAGEYHCAECGYGVTVHATLPQCPMCSGTTWEPHALGTLARHARVQ